MAKRIEVEIVGSADDLKRALRGAGRDVDGFGRGLNRAAGTAIRSAFFATGAAIAGLGVIAVKTAKDLARIEAIGAQTAAVIKSTGGAANVSREQIEKLAGSLEKMSGVEAESIQIGQNMLLTFKQIQNQVGSGNDIFDQATKAVLNLSVAMDKDMQSSAILVGKALNDPIKGLAAMGRVGIQFTESQKKAITAMVELGDTAGAQKLILKELESQFGGSAKAAGETMGGQLRILQHRFGEFAESIVSRALPALNDFLGFLGRLAERVGAATTIRGKLHIIWEATTTAVGDLWETVRGAVEDAVLGPERTVTIESSNPLFVTFPSVEVKSRDRSWAEALKAGFDLASEETARFFEAADRKIEGGLQGWADRFNAWGTGVPGRVGSGILSRMNEGTAAGDQLALRIFNAVRDKLSPLGGMVSLTFGQMVTTITQRIPAAGSAALELGQRIVSGVWSGLSELAGKVRDRLGDIVPGIFGVAGAAFSAAFRIGARIVSGVLGGLGGLAGAVKSKVESAVGWALSNINIPGRSPPEHAAAEMIGVPIGRGIVEGATDYLQNNLARNVGKVLSSTLDGISDAAAIHSGGTDIASTLKTGIDDHLESELPSNLTAVIGAGLEAAWANITAQGLGVTGFTGPLPLTHKTAPGGETVIADPDSHTVINVTLPNYIGDHHEVTDVIRSELVKLQNRNGTHGLS